MEEVRKGILRIRREMEALGCEPPVFESARDAFRVLLLPRHRNMGLPNR